MATCRVRVVARATRFQVPERFRCCGVLSGRPHSPSHGDRGRVHTIRGGGKGAEGSLTEVAI